MRGSNGRERAKRNRSVDPGALYIVHTRKVDKSIKKDWWIAVLLIIVAAFFMAIVR